MSRELHMPQVSLLVVVPVRVVASSVALRVVVGLVVVVLITGAGPPV